ncbi:MAG: hypothetical protein FWH15_09505 [Betaproteobacteria bacterium]|nr:hypothetical protein [Betaproteobacteria bacterium]
MTYKTGQAASFEDIRDAIYGAAAQAGWTAEQGHIITRPGCAVRLFVGADSAARPELAMTGGTGFDAASGHLQEPTPNRVRMGALIRDGAWHSIQFPVLYDIMAFEEEVYCFINHNVLEYQYLAFGISGIPGILGTGAWVSGTFSGASPTATNLANSSGSFALTPTSGGTSGIGNRSSGAIFADSSGLATNNASSFIHHGFTDYCASEWALGAGANMYGQYPLHPLLSAQPSAWNEGAALLPIRAYIPRPQGFMSLVAELRHARNVRVDYLDPKAVYSLSTDKWKIFPWVKKEVTARDGGSNINHSGTLGVAIRYDGT